MRFGSNLTLCQVRNLRWPLNCPRLPKAHFTGSISFKKDECVDVWRPNKGTAGESFRLGSYRHDLQLRGTSAPPCLAPALTWAPLLSLNRLLQGPREECGNDWKGAAGTSHGSIFFWGVFNKRLNTAWNTADLGPTVAFLVFFFRFTILTRDSLNAFSCFLANLDCLEIFVHTFSADTGRGLVGLASCFYISTSCISTFCILKLVGTFRLPIWFPCLSRRVTLVMTVLLAMESILALYLCNGQPTMLPCRP